MYNEECCSKKLGRRGLTVTLGPAVLCMCVTPDVCELVSLKLVCVCVCVNKVIWELRGNVNYSCNTVNRLPDSQEYREQYYNRNVIVCVYLV